MSDTWTGYIQIANSDRLPVTDETLDLAANAIRAGLSVDIYEESPEALCVFLP